MTLGKIDPDRFADGSMRLDREAALQALAAHVGTPLGLDPRSAAHGLAEVVDENMANAARVHAVENGEDLSGYTMIAFGGAAPLHAARLCEKLGIDRCLVPPGAGVGSAIGFLRAPFSFEATRSAYMTLDAFDAGRVKGLLAELTHEAAGVVRDCDPEAEIATEVTAHMRYTGQGWEIPVALTTEQARTPDAATFQTLFEAEYARLFHRTVEGLRIEVTVWAVNATTPPAPVAPVDDLSEGPTAVIDGKCSFHDPAADRFVSGYRYDRAKMKAGTTVRFPALIQERETTIVVPISRQAICQPDGCIDILRKPEEGA